MPEFILSDGSRAIVCEEDRWFLSQWIWVPHRSNGGIYAVRYERHRMISMHNEIGERMGLDVSFTIDHRDRDTLNNRRSNLREATLSQNAANSKLRSCNTTGYRGVNFDKRRKMFKAEITVEGIYMFLGYYFSAETAASVYDFQALKYFGEFAQLNFPGIFDAASSS